MHLKDLKAKTPADLVAMAEELGVEGASTMRRQDLMFCDRFVPEQRSTARPVQKDDDLDQDVPF